MKEFLKNAIDKSQTDYIDAMCEDTRMMTISFNKKEIQNVSTTILNGGRVTTIVNGGYAGASFTRPDSIGLAIEKAIRSAKALSRFDATNRLAPAPVVNDTIIPVMTINPAKISFDEKVALSLEYLDLVLKTPRIFTAQGSYSETVTQKTFVNSEGTQISQEIVLCYFSCRMMAQDGDQTESLGFTVGFDSDFSRLQNRHAEVEAHAKLTVDLLSASPVIPGVHTIVADQDLSGVFIHEAFGHLSESDDTINNPSLKKLLVLGNRLGSDELNIVDQGDFPKASGTYVYDDEGVRTRKTYLVKDGLLHDRLYSRLSAYQLDGAPTGNYRATDYRFMPLVRMSNIFIESQPHSFDEICAAVGNGYYLCGGKGGQTMGDLFTFGAQHGFEIRNGQLGRMVKDINISGNVFETLGNIAMIGDDFKMNEGGGCGKTRAGLYDMQMLDKSGTGGPSVMIRNVVIGG